MLAENEFFLRSEIMRNLREINASKAMVKLVSSIISLSGAAYALQTVIAWRDSYEKV